MLAEGGPAKVIDVDHHSRTLLHVEKNAPYDVICDLVSDPYAGALRRLDVPAHRLAITNTSA